MAFGTPTRGQLVEDPGSSPYSQEWDTRVDPHVNCFMPRRGATRTNTRRKSREFKWRQHKRQGAFCFTTAIRRASRLYISSSHSTHHRSMWLQVRESVESFGWKVQPSGMSGSTFKDLRFTVSPMCVDVWGRSLLFVCRMMTFGEAVLIFQVT